MRLVSNLAALLALTGGAAFAQDWTEPVRHDLDQDGREEVYTLRNAGSGRVALVVGGPDGEAVYPGAAFLGPWAGEPPYLMVGESGELLLTSVSEGLGIDRWTLTVTLAPGGSGLIVEGYSWSWFDTRAEADDGWRECSVNLRTGDGVLAGPHGATTFAVPAGPSPLSEWDSQNAGVPEPCQIDGHLY